MKIIQIITQGHELYGAQKHVYELSEQFYLKKHKVLVITGSEGIFTDLLKEKGISFKIVPNLVREISPINDFKALQGLKRIIRKEQPDIVATHSSKAGVLGRLAGYYAGVPTIFTAHGWSFEDGIPFIKRSIYKLIEKRMGAFSTMIITVSNLGKELAIRKNVITPDKLTTIYYGVNDLGKGTVKVRNEVFTMAMVAGLRPQKDHETLFKALHRIKNDKWKIYLLGDGPLMEQSKRRVQELGLESKVFFEGAVKNVVEYYKRTDLLVLSTNYEGLPISIIEGLSFSLPVVATNVSGVSEEVIHDFNGKLVKWKDEEDLYQAIIFCMNNPEVLKTFETNSRILYEREFTIERMFVKTNDLYKLAINNFKM